MDINLITSPSLLKELCKVKEAIRNWYGSLSIEELIRNQDLVIEIKELEELLSKAGASV